MTPEFAQTGEGLRIRLDREEASLLRQLLGEMQVLLTESGVDDRIRGRLFPTAYEKPEDEIAFRELIGDDLERGKLAAIEQLMRSLGEDGPVDATVAEGEVDAWLTVLTDMRLAMGTRLDVDEDTMAAEVDEDDPNAPALYVMHWLGWLQEMILERIDGTEGR